MSIPTSCSDASFFSPTPLMPLDTDRVEVAQRVSGSVIPRRTGTGTAAGRRGAPRPARPGGARRATTAARRCGRRLRPTPVMTVTISRPVVTRWSSSAHAAPSSDPLTATMPSPRTSPIQSPAVIGPTVAVGVAHRLGDLAGRDRLGRLGHLCEVLVGVGLGVVDDQRGERLGHRRGRHDHAPSWSSSASTCSATGMMFLLFGRTTTWSAFTARRRRAARRSTGSSSGRR